MKNKKLWKDSINARVASAYQKLADSIVAIDSDADEIEGWIIEELKNIGCDTAKSVLEISTEELLKRTDLEEETLIDVKQILQSEFE